MRPKRAFGRKAASYNIDEDGCWVLSGRFAPEQGAVIRKALEKASNALFEERRDEHPDVSAETPRGDLEEWDRPAPVAARRADALERLAEIFLAGDSGAATNKTSGGDRFIVNIHAEAEVLQADGAAAQAECEDKGLKITPRTLPADCGGEIDYGYTQGVLAQYDPDEQ